MTNYSDLTRRDQVFARLKEANGGWVDGPDLANEQVGGSEGLRRLRELVEDEHVNVRKRRHPDPDRDIWQYRLVPPPLDIPIEDGPATPAGFLAESIEKALAMPEPSEPPVYPRPDPPKPQTRMSNAVKRKEDGTFEYVPPQRSIPIPEQPLIPAAEPELAPGSSFTSMPTKVTFGEVAVCPRCRQKTSRGRPKKKELTEEQAKRKEIMDRRKSTNAEDTTGLVDDSGFALYRDPYDRKARPCSRCNGYGIVPNVGPIALAPVSPPPPPKPLDFGDEAETTEAFPE